MSQLHKRFTSEQVKSLLDRYSNREIERKYIQEILGIKKSRFFMLLKRYKEDPQNFTSHYQRTTFPRTLSPEIEKNILKELSIEKKIIQNKEYPPKILQLQLYPTATKRKIPSDSLSAHHHP